MLKEVKRIIIQDLEEYKRKRETLIAEYANLKNRKEEIDRELKVLGVESSKLLNKIIPSNKKRITEERSKIIKESNSIRSQIEEKKNEEDSIREEVMKKYLSFLKMAGYDDEFININSETFWNILSKTIEIIRQCQSLKQLGLRFYDAVDLLQKNGVPIILDESDKNYEISSSNIGGYVRMTYPKNVKDTVDLSPMEDYVLVHKTKFYPQNGRINTSKGAKVTEYADLEKIGLIKRESQRNTIHFAVNGEVGDHSMGNWADCKYAILIPFMDMPPSQFRSCAAVDTYIEGELLLPKSAIILCPQEEQRMIQQLNPSQMVVGYIGENVTHYADSMVEQLGYKVQSVGAVQWASSEDEEEYYKRLNETGLDFNVQLHGHTVEKEREKNIELLYYYIEVIKKIINNKIFLEESDIGALINNMGSILSCDYLELNIELVQILENELRPFGLTIKDESKNDFINIKPRSDAVLLQDLLMQTQQLINNDLNDGKNGEVSNSK